MSKWLSTAPRNLVVSDSPLHRHRRRWAPCAVPPVRLGSPPWRVARIGFALITLLRVAVLSLGAVVVGLGAACRSSEPAPTPADTSAPPIADGSSPNAAVLSDAASDERPMVARALARIRAGGEAWYGVYVMGKKVGHGRMAWRAPEATEPGVAVTEFEMQMAVAGGGNANTIRVEEKRYYGDAYPHPLVLTSFRQDAQGYVEARRAVPDKDGMRITRTIGGKAEPERVTAASAETLVESLAASPVEIEGLVFGQARVATTWNWEREADERLEVTPLRAETRRRAGIEQKVAVLEAKYLSMGVSATTVVGASGDVLEMSLGAAVTMKIEEKEVALSGISGLDIMGSGVKSPEPLGDPSAIDDLVFSITTQGDITIPDRAAQKVVKTDASHLEVTRIRGPGETTTEAELTEALSSDATMDADSPTVIAQAQALVGDNTTPAEKVKLIADWVFRTLDKKLATHLPSASRILATKVGDCTEHTWLTVALLRAAKVPARPVYGVAYAGDFEKTFAYHAWVEVALDGRWVWIDPTWGQALADATHLQLGKDLGAVAPSLGAITITRISRLSR